jgi:glycosyltransferase involved in cell wall biosynthesis
MSKCRVLVLVPHYLPGFESGGPIRSIVNLVDHLGGRMDIAIITSDRDAADNGPYEGIRAYQWMTVGNAKVLYVPSSDMTIAKWARLIRETPHDVLYLNSFFHLVFSIRPAIARRLRLIPPRPVVVAPRGEFSSGALGLKKWKKKLFLIAARAFGLYRDVIWHASSRFEANDIRAVMKGQARRLAVAENLPPRHRLDLEQTQRVRGPGDRLRVCFLSRITPKKNLHGALEILRHVHADIEFNIYGPIRDDPYWRTCQRLIREVPTNVTVRYGGSVPYGSVRSVLAEQDLFFLPTLGENYGHAIAEAMSVGTPVLIADTTPWRGLENDGAGWDIPLGRKDLFIEVIERVAGLTDEVYARCRRSVLAFARDRLRDPELLESNYAVFKDAVDERDVREDAS